MSNDKNNKTEYYLLSFCSIIAIRHKYNIIYGNKSSDMSTSMTINIIYKHSIMTLRGS